MLSFLNSAIPLLPYFPKDWNIPYYLLLNIYS
nr:MAG TPA: hypothetical protein [Bacteriophage sp.]